MKRLLILFSLLLLTSALSFLKAQQQNTFEVPQVVPPSPDAAALGKYGSIPVGLNTGIPEINIPLYTIKTSKLELPISLSYQAVGFKVSEIASWVGLGWALNAGGVITRSVVGRPDEGGFWEKSVKKSSQITSNDYNYLKLIADGGSGGDGESDYYFYNFNGHSGKFFYYQNDNQNPLLIPLVPIKITYPSGHYEVTDELGVIYKFADFEYEDFRDASHIQTNFKSSYYLSEIISADGTDSINFSYVVDSAYSQSDRSFSETIGQFCNGVGNLSNDYHETSDLNFFRTISAVRIREINFANGKVEFIKDYTRNDAPETRLDTIKISEKNVDGTFTLRKKIALGEDYFDSQSGNGTDRYRLKLSNVKEQDAFGITIKQYSFTYNETDMLPQRASLAQDWWGFYNGHTSNQSLIKTETISFNGFQYQVGNANRDPDSASMQACILKKIVYPTGGYTEFEYGPNHYGTSSSIMAGGLRVKKIRDYEGPGKTPLTKIYEYGPNDRGRLLIPTDILGNSRQEVRFDYGVLTSNGAQSFCNMDCSGTRMIVTGRPSYDLTTLNGAPVVYPEVTVYDSSSTAPNGKRVFHFNFVEDGNTYADKAYNNGIFQMNRSWEGGDETYNAVFPTDTTKKIEETFSTSSIYSGGTYATGTKVGWKLTREGCPFWYNPSISDFYFFDYSIFSGIKKLTSSTKRQYSSTDTTNYLEARTTFDYDSLSDLHQQLRKKTMINSSGDTSVTKYWYPDDYNRNTISGALLDKHIIAVPIKEENYRRNKLVSGKITEYNDFGNPVQIDLYETSQPQTIPTHDPNTLFPSGYVKRADLVYDGNKNLQYVQKSDNIKVSYIWGYGNTLPIAEIKNATLDSMNTNYNSTNEISIDITSRTSQDTPLTPTFEVFSNQNITPTVNVTRLGSTGPDNPLLSIKLKSSDGSTLTTLGCAWDSHSVGPISLSPGVYQWYYYSNVTTGGGFNGDHLSITTNYTSQRTGYKTFYTSFEENGQTNTEARTGTKVWSGIYELNLPGYNGDYKLSYWEKTGAGPWRLIEQGVTITSGNVQPMNIGAAGSIIDEVRLYPVGAEMTTYTYDLLNGLTSMTDPNQNTTYYEYDSFGRLQIIRDMDHKILKKYSYHYKE